MDYSLNNLISPFAIIHEQPTTVQSAVEFRPASLFRQLYESRELVASAPAHPFKNGRLSDGSSPSSTTSTLSYLTPSEHRSPASKRTLVSSPGVLVPSASTGQKVKSQPRDIPTASSRGAKDCAVLDSDGSVSRPSIVFTHPVGSPKKPSPQTPTSAPSSQGDKNKPKYRHVNEFKPLAPVESDAKPDIKNLFWKYPPNIVSPKARAPENALISEVRPLAGFDDYLEPLLKQNEDECCKFADYAIRENGVRQGLYNEAYHWTEEYEHGQHYIAGFGPDRSNARQSYRFRSPREYREQKADCQEYVKLCEQKLEDVAARLWDQKMQRDDVISTALRWKPFPLKPPRDEEKPIAKRNPVPRDVLPDPYNEAVSGAIPPDPVKRPEFPKPINERLQGTGFEKERTLPPLPEDVPDAPAPAWFKMFDSTECMIFQSEETDTDARYKELLEKIWQLEQDMDDEKHNGGPKKSARRNWNVNLHRPHPGWPKPWQRERGGWWKCRLGPEATRMENVCANCHVPRRPDFWDVSNVPTGPVIQPTGQDQRTWNNPDWTTKRQYEWLMKRIRLCVEKVGEADKVSALIKVRTERAEADEMVKQDGWKCRAGFLRPKGFDKPKETHHPITVLDVRANRYDD